MDKRVPFKNFQAAKTFAQTEICKHDSNLASKFLQVLAYCFQDPDNAGGISRLPKLCPRWIELKAGQFARERITPPPQITELFTDPLISEIGESFFEISEIDTLIEHHKIGMAAEQIIGQLLEEYIASKIEILGWIWCSGKMIKATDFIKFPSAKSADIILLQVKNRSNSENSSSAKIRAGTKIQKWHRMDAETGATDWTNFPKILSTGSLSEQDFQDFVAKKVEVWKQELGMA